MHYYSLTNKARVRADVPHHPTLILWTLSSSPIGPSLKGPQGQILPGHQIIKKGFTDPD